MFSRTTHILSAIAFLTHSVLGCCGHRYLHAGVNCCVQKSEQHDCGDRVDVEDHSQCKKHFRPHSHMSDCSHRSHSARAPRSAEDQCTKPDEATRPVAVRETLQNHQFSLGSAANTCKLPCRCAELMCSRLAARVIVEKVGEKTNFKAMKPAAGDQIADFSLQQPTRECAELFSTSHQLLALLQSWQI